MSKKTVIKKLKKAIENNPHKKDIKKISIFGSYINSTPRTDSDVDLLVEFNSDAQVGFFKLIDIQENIEHHLNKPVDLVTKEALSKYIKKRVIKQAKIIYEK